MTDDLLPEPVDAPDFRDDPEAGEDRRRILPEGCAVTPVGFKGKTYYLLDEAQQFIDMKAREFDKGNLIGIFGGSRQVAAIWPKMKNYGSSDEPDWRPVRHLNHKTDKWEVWDFNQNLAQADLIEACREKGVFDPQGRIFGRGAHRRKSDDALVFHLGNRIITVETIESGGKPELRLREDPAGWLGKEIYPGMDPLPAPSREPSTPEEAQAAQAMIGKWVFEEPEAAKLIVLGFIGQCFLCGAFSWRAHVWLTGETAAGKSTLQKWIRSILDAFGLFTEDASEAAVRQVLDNDTLPVLIDEAEADDNPERQKAILNLARKASSGGTIYRGSQDQKGAREFTAQSCFLFSSIIHSEMQSQDRNRFAILPMRAIPAGTPDLQIDWKYWRQVGRRFHKRMIDQWPRFDRTLADYKLEIAGNGFEGRWRDTFGTLLACADMLLHECAPSAESEANPEHGRQVAWVQAILPLMHRSRVEAQTTTERCIIKLVSSLLAPAPGNHAETVGKWINRAITPDEQSGEFNNIANEKLRTHGMRVVNLHEKDSGGLGYVEVIDPDKAFVAIAYSTNVGMRDLFKGSQWQNGGWIQALEAAEGARKGVKVKFTGKSDNAICVPVKALIGMPGVDDE